MSVIGVIFTAIVGLLQMPLSVSAMHMDMMTESHGSQSSDSGCVAECSLPVDCIKECLDEARSDNRSSLMLHSQGSAASVANNDRYENLFISFSERLISKDFQKSKAISIILATQKRE